MKVAELKRLVVEEATALKTNAKLGEIEKLNFEALDPTEHTACIYGQMTGSCFSKRAMELIKKCATTMIDGRIGDTVTPVMDRQVTNKRVRVSREGTKYWSPIEVFIAINRHENKAKIEPLIKFLKGEKEVLNLK